MTSSAANVPRRSSSSMRRREAIEGWLYLSPWVIGFILFVAGPLLAALYFSFTKYNVLRPPQFIGFKNYIDAFVSDPLFLPSIVRSFYYAALSVPLGLIGSLFVAVLLNQKLRAHLLFFAHTHPFDCRISALAVDAQPRCGAGKLSAWSGWH